MYLVDFIYDGFKLSNFGCMVGSAVTDNSDSIEMGSVVKLETAVNHGSYRSEIVNADYPDTYSVTFDIFKTPCATGKGYDDVFTDKEVTWFMRWLNRKDYHRFQPIYDDPKDFYRIFFNGTFTECKAIAIQGHVYGFTLTFTSDSPFAYLDYKPNTYTVKNLGDEFTIIDSATKQEKTLTGGTFIIYDESEELGAVYPKSITINLASAGDLIIKNSMDDAKRYTEIKNCVANETLTFDCIHKVISSDKEDQHAKFFNDFNYVFPRLVNEFYDGKNKFNMTINGTVVVDYNPIRKVGVIA